MRKKVFKYFLDFLAQEQWLNKMGSKGYKLVKTSKFFYEFEYNEDKNYQYKLEFIGHMPYKEIKDYKKFLEDFGYEVFLKNMNLNFSIGKIRWRPTANIKGQLVTNPGAYNKEILIVEKEKGKEKFQLRSNNVDIINHFKEIKKVYLSIVLLFLGLGSYNIFFKEDYKFIILAILVTFVLGKIIFKYSKKIREIKETARMYE